MRKKFVQIAAFLLALCMFPVSYAGAEPETELFEAQTAAIDNNINENTNSSVDESSTASETNPSSPEQNPLDSPDETTDPEQGTTESDGDATDPEQGTTEPGGDSTDPEQGTADPGGEDTDPEQGTTEPGGEPTDPEQGTTEPVEPEVPEVIVPVLETEEVSGDVIRVGLYHGSNALAGGNLANSVGSGFRFGYEDGGVFYKVGFTAQTAISVVKAKNVYYSSKLSDNYSGYSDSIKTDVAVGCVHLLLPGTYATFEETKAAADAVNGFPAWVNGEFQVRIGVYLSADDARAAQAALGLNDATVVGTSANGMTIVVTGTSKPIFQYDGGAEFPMFIVKPGLDNTVKTQTIFKGRKYYGSFRYERIDGGNLNIINLVDNMDDYVRGVIPYEMSSSWPLEALKAQAVAARSYAVANTNSTHLKNHFDVCATECCQVYRGTNSATAHTDQAVDETMGQYAWYGNEVILAVFHSSDGGATENCENVWNDALPYLRGVIDPYEILAADKNPHDEWTKTYTGAQLQKILNGVGFKCAEIVDVKVSKTTDTGNVHSLTFIDANGKSWTLSKYKNVKSLMGMKSMRYTVSGGGDGFVLADNHTLSTLAGTWALNGEGNLVEVNTTAVYALTADGVVEVSGANQTAGTFAFTGSGSGHNLGMSQWGAYAMAKEGYTYDQILKFYFTGIEIHE